MFGYLTKIESLNLSNFRTPKVTCMDGIFLGNTNLSTLGISNFDTSKLYKVDSMFQSCSKLTNIK